MKRYFLYSLIIGLFLMMNQSVKADNLIFKIDIKKEIGSTTWLYIQEGFREANEKNASAILIHMNTYGGEVVYADSIRTKILNSTIPVYVFVDNNAASAGALISIACDKIFIRPGGSIGAATVVNQTGEQMPDKYQSYMRATMRATAEAQGKDTVIQDGDTIIKWKRDPLIAEAMVDDRTVIPGIIDSGKTLTFTALEAVKYGYAEGIANNVDEVITKFLMIKDYTLETFRPTTFDNLKGFLMSTFMQGILIMLIIGGIYFELQTPGIGFPLGVAITAAVLYFAPLYMDGLAANWEILIFVIGLVLLAVEIFVIPGFGLAGISGIVLIFSGLVLSLLDNVDFDFTGVNTSKIARAMFTVTVGIGAGFGLMIYLSSKIGAKGLFRNVALKTSMENASGYIGVPMEQKELIGKSGTAHTDLRPSGRVEVAGQIYDAVSDEGFIEKNSSVRIVKYETGQIYVVRA